MDIDPGGGGSGGGEGAVGVNLQTCKAINGTEQNTLTLMGLSPSIQQQIIRKRTIFPFLHSTCRDFVSPLFGPL